MRALCTMAVALSALVAASCSRTPEPDHAYDEGTIVMFGGDTFFGESYVEGREDKPHARLTDQQRYVDAMAEVAPLMRDSDYAVVNFEAPLSRKVPGIKPLREILHWSDPDKSIAAMEHAGIDAISLANNHALDQDRIGLARTLNAVAASKIKSFGAGRNLQEAERPLTFTVTLPGGGQRRVAVFGLFQVRTNYRDVYKFYASHGISGNNPVDIGRFRDQVAQLRKQDPQTYVVAFPHWGGNYTWANDRQVALGHRLIASGADIVIGAHGHTIQEVERYNGKWILYGIGNFAFGSPGRYRFFPDNLPYGVAVGLSFGMDPTLPPQVRLFPMTANNRINDFKTKRVSLDVTRQIDEKIASRPFSKGYVGKPLAVPGGTAIELGSD